MKKIFLLLVALSLFSCRSSKVNRSVLKSESTSLRASSMQTSESSLEVYAMALEEKTTELANFVAQDSTKPIEIITEKTPTGTKTTIKNVKKGSFKETSDEKKENKELSNEVDKYISEKIKNEEMSHEVKKLKWTIGIPALLQILTPLVLAGFLFLNNRFKWLDSESIKKIFK